MICILWGQAFFILQEVFIRLVTVTGSHHDFWTCNKDIFLKRFYFLLRQFHRLRTVMILDCEYFMCDTCKYSADVCMMVLLWRLSYSCTFWQIATEFSIPSNRLCEIFHTTLEIISNRYHGLIEFETWTPFFHEMAKTIEDHGSPMSQRPIWFPGWTRRQKLPLILQTSRTGQ